MDEKGGYLKKTAVIFCAVCAWALLSGCPRETYKYSSYNIMGNDISVTDAENFQFNIYKKSRKNIESGLIKTEIVVEFVYRSEAWLDIDRPNKMIVQADGSKIYCDTYPGRPVEKDEFWCEKTEKVDFLTCYDDIKMIENSKDVYVLIKGKERDLKVALGKDDIDKFRDFADKNVFKENESKEDYED